jgi:DNA repair and recombination protein RAD52
MKRRLSETEMKPDPDALQGKGAGDLQQTVATLVAQQVAAALLAPLSGASEKRFGRVAFPSPEQQSVDAFLRQKLGKDSLARRPGPGGRKLTYIESCKAIELANRAFGFNGWSCRIVECKEEFKEKKGDRWSIGYSSLVRIELKDGTSHEDVGFGSSDGQRDLGAALEQAKKASISDARKRALRLFGEYLGNSCYDREHIKDVISNKPMAPLASAPGAMLPPPQGQNGASPQQPPVVSRQPGMQNGQAVPPQPVQQQQQRPQQPVQQQQVQLPPRQQLPQTVQPQRPPMQQQQHAQPQRQPMQQQRPQMPQQAVQQQQWKPPQVLRNPPATNGSSSMHHQPAQVSSGVSAGASRTMVMQSSASNSMSTTVTSSASSTSPFRPQPQRWVSSNAPPPPRMMSSSYPLAGVKAEHPRQAQAQPSTQFNMEDLSLSQFDYDPNAENSNPAKKLRS